METIRFANLQTVQVLIVRLVLATSWIVFVATVLAIAGILAVSVGHEVVQTVDF